MFRLAGIDHVALTVRDVARSVAWYETNLGLERQFREAWGDYPAVVGTPHGGGLALFPVRSDHPDPPPGSDTLCFRHVAFRVDRPNFEAAQRAFTEKGIDFRFQDHDVARSIYLADPDGHEIEITTYDLGE